MNGAQSLFKALVDAGLDTCFANPGTSEMQLVYEMGPTEHVRPVLCLQENTVTGAADGHAQMAGKPAFTLLHVGAGFANGIANLHNAGRANTPVVNIVGANATYHQPNFPEHELIGGKITGLTQMVSHWSHEAKSASDLAVLGAMAARYARIGSGKVCTVVAPTNCHWDPSAGTPVAETPISTPRVSPETIQECVERITSGKKTGLILGAFSLDIPMVVVPAGPMMKGPWRGQDIASGTIIWQTVADCGAGRATEADLVDLEHHEGTSAGTCMSMNTGTTMSLLSEVLGVCLPGAASATAPSAENGRNAVLAGQLAVELAWRNWKPSDYITRKSFENALVAYMALAGSTNGILHLLAIAGRAGIPLSVDDFNPVSDATPVLADVAPSGKYVMQDFHNAGGMPGLLNERLRDRLHLDFLLKQGVTDMVRISDARISGTCYGTQILHIAPEAWVGGPIGLIRTGDEIELDVEKGELNLLISDEEMAKRKGAWKAPEPRFERGYYKLAEEQTLQADQGYDWEILRGTGGAPKDPRIG